MGAIAVRASVSKGEGLSESLSHINQGGYAIAGRRGNAVGKSISLTGKTIHTTGADGVTPGRFLGYEFRNHNYLYQVRADGTLLIYQGKKLIVKEQGALTY